MRWIVGILLFLLVALQARLWLGQDNLIEMWRLQKAVTLQQASNKRLAERNKALQADVKDLKSGLQAVEERSRSELGMVKQGEVFYQVVEQ